MKKTKQLKIYKIHFKLLKNLDQYNLKKDVKS